MEVTDEQRNKSHKSRTTGNKVVRRDDQKKKKAGIDTEPNRGKNPKAFQGRSIASSKSKMAEKSAAKKEMALHLPTMDKTFAMLADEPPLLVCVVGPPKSGKTTLIRSMVKFYSNRNVVNIRGPITVVAGRSRRLTFLECPNTLASMCDVAKVADIILLMVDGNYGFEMETFEFLNIAQVHGMPKIMGVVSHLDQLKTSKALKKRKNFLRHRFWHEVAHGAKILCLSPMQNGLYRSTDVLKFHRILICVQTKIQNWRSTHSCVLIDRHEDLTNPDVVASDEKCNRTVAFYGYVRGRPMKPGQLVHIPGLGDFPLSHLSHQEDPCMFADGRKGTSQGHKMRHLTTKQKRYYAPYSDIGGVTFDENAIYIAEDSERQNIERSGEGLEILRALQKVNPIDELGSSLTLVRRPLNFKNDESLEPDIKDEDVLRTMDEDEDDDDDDDDSYFEGRNSANDLSKYGAEAAIATDFDDMPLATDAADELPEFSFAPRHPHDLDSVRINTCRFQLYDDASFLQKLKKMFVTGWQPEGAEGGEEPVNEDDKGYDSNDEEFEQEIREQKKRQRTDDDEVSDESSNDGGGDKITLTKPTASKNKMNALAHLGPSMDIAKGDGKRMSSSTKTKSKQQPAAGDSDDGYDVLKDETVYWDDPEVQKLVDHFTGGGSGPSSRINATAEGALRTGDKVSFFDPADKFKKSHEDGSDVDKDEEAAAALIGEGKQLTEEQEAILKKRMAKKKAFDDSYDVDGSKNATTGFYHALKNEIELKKAAISEAVGDMQDTDKKIKLVGYFSGLYVRFVIEKVPVEFIRNFNPVIPLIAGGLNPGEDQLQMVHAKIKRHRWYPRILKAQDPLLISIGWRRVQTQPIYASEDSNGRLRYLKYTPLHMHCNCAFYAPVAPTNTGFIAIPVEDLRIPHFRCYATGYTVGNDNCTAIVKKLKLTGTPQKIQKTTAFIKGMFNSDIEAAKFVGAKLKAVSGLRGMIKAVIKGKHGIVRATFEDKLLASDIVFIRAWKSVDPPRYCSMMPNLIDPMWRGMRTTAQLRRDFNVPNMANPDSEYKSINRRRVTDDDEPQKVLISRATRLQLPFSMKEDFIPLAITSAALERKTAATTIVPEPREMRRKALIHEFTDKADHMNGQKKEARRLTKIKAKREAVVDAEEYARALKKAKKETARKQEFKTQHKTRK